LLTKTSSLLNCEEPAKREDDGFIFGIEPISVKT
jgi:hypothetical protein